MHSDFLELLRLLESHKVKYLIIGGYAVGIHAEPRATKDLDIWIESSIANGKKLLQALKEFGAPVDNLTPQEIAKPGLLYVFGVPPLRVDILNRVKGSSFQAAYKTKIRVEIKQTIISVVSKAVLIKLKKATDRLQDRADLEKLKNTRA